MVNDEKHNRIFDPKFGVGKNPTDWQILAHYDKFGGFIKDENGNKVENGIFWNQEKERLVKIQTRKEKWGRVIKWPVIIGKYLLEIIAVLAAAYLVYKFGWNK